MSSPLTSLDAVVLAAGKSVRMRSDQPKVLHDLAGWPLLQHVLVALEEAGIRRPVVVVGHGRDAVRARFADLDAEWVVQEKQLGTGHAVKVAHEAVRREEVLIVCGDTPLIRGATLRRLYDFHVSCGAEATVLTFRPDDPTGYGRVLRGADGGVMRIVEEADASFDEKQVHEVNSGIYVFRSRTLFSALDNLSDHNKQGEYYLTDVVAGLAREGRQVAALEAEDPNDVLGVNSRRDLAEAAHWMRLRIVDELMAEGVTVVDPATTYVDRGVQIGRDTVIHPCTVVRTGVRVGCGCSLGPFAHLRGDTELAEGAEVGNFTEVKTSRLGAGSKAKHLAYIGDAILGSKVNVGAGTVFANYDGKAKHTTHVGDGAFIGSGTVLVAPVKVGRGAYTGAGSVVTRGQDVADGQVVVGVPAKPLAKRGDT